MLLLEKSIDNLYGLLFSLFAARDKKSFNATFNPSLM